MRKLANEHIIFNLIAMQTLVNYPVKFTKISPVKCISYNMVPCSDRVTPIL